MAENKADVVDKMYFQDLSEKNPKDICDGTSCQYDDTNKRYLVSVWKDEYIIYPNELRIEYIKQNSYKPHGNFYLFVIFFLLNSKKSTPLKENTLLKEWISEKDIPGGTTFFRGPHEIPTNLISRQYENNIEAFQKRCIELGGTKLDFADAAYSFSIVPQIPVSVLYWQGDEDFPAEAKILFDRGIIDLLPSDIIFILACEVCARIGIR